MTALPKRSGTGTRALSTGMEQLSLGLLLHLESSVLADKFEFGFMESVET
jgi:hypothetical protein